MRLTTIFIINILVITSIPRVIIISSIIEFINIMITMIMGMITMIVTMIATILRMITSKGRLGARVSPPPRPTTLT